MSYLLFFAAFLLVVLARSGVKRPSGHRPAWVFAMAGSELAGFLFLVSLGLLAGFRAAGWAGGPVGSTAQVLLVLAMGFFTLALVRGWRSYLPVEQAVAAFVGDGARVSRPGPSAFFMPFPRVPRGVEVEEALAYGPHRRHVLDRIGPSAGSDRSPALVYVHGGGFWRGRRDTQARPMIHRLARSGWQVFTPAYRLSPEATFPDHLVDVKRAVTWIRDNAADLGVDPGFIAIAGGSSGGNLAALTALTATEPTLQPGFEGLDASVQACIPFYGVHDMLRESGEPLWPYLAETVMKSSPRSAPEAWRGASPIRMATRHRPPFFVVHGATDTLVHPSVSRRLIEALQEAGGPPVGHAEIPWGNHGFDFFAGPRGQIGAAAVEAVLAHLYATHDEVGERWADGSWPAPDQ